MQMGLFNETGSDINLAKIGGVTELLGDKTIKPEKPHTIIRFPGGNVEIARTRHGLYWVHLAVRTEAGEEVPGQVIGARIDCEGRYADQGNAALQQEIDAGDVSHIAFLIQPGGHPR